MAIAAFSDWGWPNLGEFGVALCRRHQGTDDGFRRGSAQFPHLRTVEAFLSRVQNEYGAVLEVLKTDMVHQLMSFRKKPERGIRKFRSRFKKLQLRWKQVGIVIDDAVQFTQLFQALSLSTPQRHMLLSVFETPKTQKTVNALRDVAIKMFGAFDQEATSTFAATQPQDGSSESSDDSDQVLVAQKKKIDKKPGM